MGPVRALLFDLGGVVIDVDFSRVLRAWARSAGCDPAGLRERFTFDQAYQRHERGELDAAGYFAALRRTLGLRLSDEDFTAGWNDVYAGAVAGARAAGLQAVLVSSSGDIRSALHGLGIVTSCR